MITLWLAFAWLMHSANSLTPDLSGAIGMYGLGEYQKAAESLANQSLTRPLEGDLRFWLGKSYYRLRRWDDAIREFERAVRIEPSNSSYHLWLGRAFGRKAEHSPFFLALVPARKLLKEFETAVRLSPENMDARFDLLEFYLNAPSIIGGGHDRAKAQVREIARIDPRLGCAALARLYENEKKYDWAREELKLATVKFPAEAEAWVDLADYCLRRSAYSDAEHCATKALELTRLPGHRAKLILTASWVRLGKNLTRAERTLQTLSAGPLGDDDPPFEDVYYWLGQARLGLGQAGGAREAFKAALRFNPDHSHTKAALAYSR